MFAGFSLVALLATNAGTALAATAYTSVGSYYPYMNSTSYNGGCNGSALGVTVSPTSSSPTAGSTNRFSIQIQNCMNLDEQVNVLAIIDNDFSFSSASMNGYSNGRNSVIWKNVVVRAGGQQTISLTVLVGSYTSGTATVQVKATDQSGNSAIGSSIVTISGGSCYYNYAGQYTCNGNNNSNNCYYNSNGSYICGNSSGYNYSTNQNCYYDYRNRYVCNNYNNNNYNYSTPNQYCYYDYRNHYICNNNYNYNTNYNYSTTNSNCYYDSNYNYICPGTNGSTTCYYNSNGQYQCSPYSCSGNRSCYYDSNNNYRCTDTCGTNASSCYYNAAGQYICGGNNGGCYLNGNGQYICPNTYNNYNCSYQSNGQYICGNNNYNYANGGCYYDSHSNYICPNGNNCYTTNGHYVCQ
jgi:hypothetical protein